MQSVGEWFSLSSAVSPSFVYCYMCHKWLSLPTQYKYLQSCALFICKVILIALEQLGEVVACPHVEACQHTLLFAAARNILP